VLLLLLMLGRQGLLVLQDLHLLLRVWLMLSACPLS
jgi:hypothetical protein